MSAGGGDFDGAFHVLLALHVGEVHVLIAAAGEEGLEVFAHGSEVIFVGEEGEGLRVIAYAEDIR